MSKPPRKAPFRLECVICPTNTARQFSDLSHLLTHLNAKGHLQNKHKLELQAPVDEDAQIKLDEFDTWYKANGIGKLLADRLNPNRKKSSTRSRKTVEAKPESDFEDNDPVDTRSNTRGVATRLSYNNDQTKGEDDSWEQESLDTPKQTRRVPGFERDETPVDPAIIKSSKGSTGDLIEANSKGKGGGPTVLKGERFDGMDVFDAATPKTKRGRNQRKGPEVLQQMIKNSTEVQPAEISYHPSGAFRGQRHIYGPLSAESSPERRKSPSPKKRRVVRNVLQNKSVNTLRNKVTKPQKKAVAPTSTKPTHFPLEREYSGFNFANQRDDQQLGGGHTLNPFRLLAESTAYSRFYTEEDKDFNLDSSREKKHNPMYGQAANPILYQSDSIPGIGVGFFRHEENRGKAAGSWENPLNQNNFTSFESPSEQSRLLYSGNPFQQSFGSHLNESNVLTSSPTPMGRLPKQKEVNNNHHSSQPPKAFPKPGMFRTISTNIKWPALSSHQSKDRFPSDLRASSSATQDQRPFDSSCRNTQAAAPTQSPIFPSRLDSQQQTPLNKGWGYQTHSGFKREYDSLEFGDDDISASPNMSFRPHASSALRSTIRSQEHSSVRRAVRSNNTVPFGSDLDHEIYGAASDGLPL